MKTFIQTLKDLEKAKKTVEAIKTRQADTKKEIDNLRSLSRIEREKQASKIYTIYRSLKDDLDSLEDEETKAKLLYYFTLQNARIILFKKVRPLIFEVLQKYEGKQAGEKTRKALRADLMNATKAENSTISSNEISITKNHIDIDIYVSYNSQSGSFDKFIDSKNTIRAVDPQFYYIYNNRYVDNLNTHIKKLFASYEQVKKKAKEFEEACTIFNSLASIEQLSRIYKTPTIYDKLYIN